MPLFVSARRLRDYRNLPRALGEWALDSGGFTELNLHGRWTISPQQYAEEVFRWREAVGNLAWASIQDWMCEPFVTSKTGKTVQEHQRLTIENYLALTRLAPEIQWMPVLQGWLCEDYESHVGMYAEAGVNLTQIPLVGLGSICRRQHTAMAEEIIRHLHALGIKLHGFGFKLDGLRRATPYLSSADSMAWSLAARYEPPMPGHTHKTCSNCLPYALRWRRQVTDAIDDPRPRQSVLWT